MRERTRSLLGVCLKIFKDKLIFSRVQTVSSALLLALVQEHCGFENGAEKVRLMGAHLL